MTDGQRFGVQSRQHNATTRLAGHAMSWEGQALDSTGRFADRNSRSAGRTRCECGQWSPELPSNGARKRWHREHKTAVRTGLAESDMTDRTGTEGQS